MNNKKSSNSSSIGGGIGKSDKKNKQKRMQATKRVDIKHTQNFLSYIN